MTATPAARPTQAGAVLVVVVLVMLATFGLGHGLLLAARYELVAARAGARHLELRAAAEGAVERALTTAGGDWMDTIALGRTGPANGDSVAGVRTAWTLRRLDAEGWLAEAAAWRVNGPRVDAARLVWVLDPVERTLDLGGVVGVGTDAPVVVDGAIDAGALTAVLPPLTSSLCPPLSVSEAQRLAAVVPVERLDGDGLRPGLGALSFDRLLAATADTVQGSGTPAPVERTGVCVDEPWSWGDPDRPYRPCGAELPLRAAAGDLVVDGGTGQGLLIVDGDLTLTGGARYHGLVIVAGRLDIRGGAELAGYAMASGGVEVESGSRVIGSACWMVRALRANRTALAVPVPRAEPLGPL